MLDVSEVDAVIRSLHQKALRLDVVAVRHHTHAAHRDGFMKRIGDRGWFRCQIIALGGRNSLGIFYLLRFEELGFLLASDGKGSDILIISTLASSRLQLPVLITFGLPHLHAFYLLTATHNGIGPYHLLHRFGRKDRRIACQGETVADMNAHVKPQGVGLLERVIHHLPELR